MIKKLKRRFIVLAMVSLAVLLSVIVAGMNIINYNKVVSDADTRLDVLEENSERLLMDPGSSGLRIDDPGSSGFQTGDPDSMVDWNDFFNDINDSGERPMGGRGPGGPSMTRDEAEESRFFLVTLDENGSVEKMNTERISSIDTTEAEKMAQEALASGTDAGFIGDFRYSIDTENGTSCIVFLDCGRVLNSFRNYLKASILMSVLGLVAVFFVILYFAGRIVRPVAESYEKQKRFITDAGHEIKTPLAIIKANIDLMDMEIDSGVEGRQEGISISGGAADNLKENLGDINDQIDRLTGLTNDLVYLSRMEEADSSLVMTEVPFSDIVSETVSSFEPLAEERGKMIGSSIEPMISVRGNAKELEKLISIIVENAIKYSKSPRVIDCGEEEDGMPVPPVIDIVLRKEGKNAVLEVCNETENELTNEQLSHVFERFYRMDRSRNSQTGGHGIGLSMANAIVNAHAGHISARTTNGHNFIITAAIPLQ